MKPSSNFVLDVKKKYIFGFSVGVCELRMNSCDEYLFDAVRAGRVLDVCAAIASGANVNATDSSGQRPLNVAAAFAHRFDCMIELLLHGADVNACDSTYMDYRLCGAAVLTTMKAHAVAQKGNALRACDAPTRGTARHKRCDARLAKSGPNGNRGLRVRVDVTDGLVQHVRRPLTARGKHNGRPRIAWHRYRCNTSMQYILQHPSGRDVVGWETVSV